MPRQIPRTASACLLVVALLGPVGSLAPVASASRSGPSRDIAFARYDGTALSAGSHRGTVVTDAGVGFGTPTGKTELRRAHLRAGPLDRPLVDVVVRLQRAGRVVVGKHAGRQLRRGRGARPQQQGGDVVLGPPGSVDLRRQVRAPHHADPADRRPRLGRRRHLEGQGQRWAGLLAAPPLALPQGGHHGSDSVFGGRDDEPAAARHVGRGLHTRPRRGHRAGRAVVLADGPLRPLPAVGWRRRGVVLADLDVDGARLLRRAAEAVPLPVRAGRHTPPRGSTTPPARPTTRRTRAPATGRSTPRTPRRSPVKPSSPGCGRCARPRRSSPLASRWSRRCRGARAS